MKRHIEVAHAHKVVLFGILGIVIVAGLLMVNGRDARREVASANIQNPIQWSEQFGSGVLFPACSSSQPPASPEPEPVIPGVTSCTSAPNACGQTRTGTYTGFYVFGIDHPLACGAATPLLPDGYGTMCESAPSCGRTQSNGTIQCDGSCSSTPPACVCPDNLAYSSSDGTCHACNGGCTGPGGTPANPNGPPPGLVCNNGASNPFSCDSFPVSTASLSVAPTIIDEGQSATLSWSSSSNATSCTGIGFSTGGATSGIRSTGALTQTSSYQISCAGPGGSSTIQSTTVTVLHPDVSINANPVRVVAGGGTSSISWEGAGVSSCAVTRNGTAWKTGLSSSGVSDTVTAQTVYTVTCQTNGSPITRSATVNIVPSFGEF